MWLPNVEHIDGNSAGAMNGDGSRKLLLHTTEGGTIAGAVAAYRTNNSWPTFTVDCPKRRIVEHLPLEVAARSLRNERGGADTNKEGSCLVQVEMIGFAASPGSIGSPADLAWFGAELVAPVCRLMGIPVRSTVTWRSYPASYGLNASQRLSAAAWDAYNGLLGHQHAPENTHGDPGAINIAAIIAGATSQPPSTGDGFLADLTEAEQQRILTFVDIAWQAFNMSGQSTKWSGNTPGRVDVLYDERNKGLSDADVAKIAEAVAAALAPPPPPAE